VDRSTVLVVEDEPGILTIARLVLTRAGYEVIAAEDGPAAVAAYGAAADRVAVVVLDLNLPGLNGWKVLAQLRGHRPDLRVVVTTGSNYDEPVGEEPDHLPTAFLPKPYRPADLVAIVGRVLAAR
jgi:CheY-like chemotaxis protein